MVLEQIKTKEEQKESKPKNKSINYNTKNINNCVGHTLVCIAQLERLVKKLVQWNARYTIEICGDMIDPKENEFLLKIARYHNPLDYSGGFRSEDYWQDKQRPSVEYYLSKRIVDGPTDGIGNRDTFFNVFITDNIVLTKTQEEQLTEFDKDILHWARQSNPKHFFYYWYRRKNFDYLKDETQYENEKEEFIRKQKELEEDENEVTHWIKMSHLLKMQQEASGPVPQKILDDLKKLQLENNITLEQINKKNVEL